MADSFQTTPENRDATIAKSRADASQGKREAQVAERVREMEGESEVEDAA